MVDVRLLSQVELNLLRTDAYTRISQTTRSFLPQNETEIRAIVDNTRVELSLWLEEWVAVVAREPDHQQASMALQNLRIQHEWALMTLNLKAIAASGIENIALMSEYQLNFVCLAKEAASRHLRYMLRGNSTPSSAPTSDASPEPTYLGTFRWTLDYVWAKCAVSVLLVLKLAILLRDPAPSVISLLRDAHRVLEELKTVTFGHISYFRILQVSVEKWEAVLQEYVAEQSVSIDASKGPGTESGSAETDFQDYVPVEFVFDWEFPGLNLKRMPLGWQDLFVNIDNLF